MLTCIYIHRKQGPNFVPSTHLTRLSVTITTARDIFYCLYTRHTDYKNCSHVNPITIRLPCYYSLFVIIC